MRPMVIVLLDPLAKALTPTLEHGIAAIGARRPCWN
jgi:hypothetical protein